MIAFGTRGGGDESVIVVPDTKSLTISVFPEALAPQINNMMTALRGFNLFYFSTIGV